MLHASPAPPLPQVKELIEQRRLKEEQEAQGTAAREAAAPLTDRQIAALKVRHMRANLRIYV
jgi:hypothetical protein